MKPASSRSVIAILAAGASRRLGQPKQLVRIGGVTLLQRAVDVARGVARASRAEVWLALGHEADQCWNSLNETDGLVRIDVSDAGTGMSASLRAIARSAQSDAAIERLLVLMVDQHAVDDAWLTSLLACSERFPERMIGSVYNGLRGAPAVFPRVRFADLASLEGDAGARHVLRAASDREFAAFPAPRAPGDVDRIEDLREFD